MSLTIQAIAISVLAVLSPFVAVAVSYLGLFRRMRRKEALLLIDLEDLSKEAEGEFNKLRDRQLRELNKLRDRQIRRREERAW